MKTQTIEVEGLPDGFKLCDIDIPARMITQIDSNILRTSFAIVITLEKIQPRKIVLEEISKEEYYRLFHDEQCTEIYNLQRSHWKQVKETDLSLNSDEPYKKLSVDDARELLNYLPKNTEFYGELVEFIKENS